MIREKAVFFRAPDLDELEMLRATYVRHTFSRHTHPGYVIGMIERGVEVFHYRGRLHHACAGDVVVINPDMVHTGHAGHRLGWTYRMFYPSIEIMLRVADQIAGRPAGMPYFTQAVIKDPDMAARLWQLHFALERTPSALERQTRFHEVMGLLVLRHAGNPPSVKRIGSERDAVRQAIDFIEATLSENISLEMLSARVGLSPFHLSRVFRRQTGLPPHAYRKQQRIQLVKRLLAQGVPIAEAAVQAGFSDQSHLTRHFKQIVGVTPGRYTAVKSFGPPFYPVGSTPRDRLSKVNGESL